MKRKTVSVCFLVAILGIAAAVAGFAAEATRVKNAEIQLIYDGSIPEALLPEAEPETVNCWYPNSPAMGLTIAAVVEFMATQVIIASMTGGYCSCLQSIPNLPKQAQVSIATSWIALSTSIILFLTGAILNSKQGPMRESDGEYHCYVMRSGVFRTAAIMGLVSVALALVYYISYASATKRVADKLGLELDGPRIANGKKEAHRP